MGLHSYNASGGWKWIGTEELCVFQWLRPQLQSLPGSTETQGLENGALHFLPFHLCPVLLWDILDGLCVLHKHLQMPIKSQTRRIGQKWYENHNGCRSHFNSNCHWINCPFLKYSFFYQLPKLNISGFLFGAALTEWPRQPFFIYKPHSHFRWRPRGTNPGDTGLPLLPHLPQEAHGTPRPQKKNQNIWRQEADKGNFSGRKGKHQVPL